VYLHALRRGLLVVVYTNGTLITERIADLFADHKPQLVEITLYGMTRETYEKVTQIAGSYDKCLAGIRRLVERGVPLKLKTMALSWNYHELPAMREFATGLGLKFRYDSSLNARVDCGANRNGELQLNADQAARWISSTPRAWPTCDCSWSDSRAPTSDALRPSRCTSAGPAKSATRSTRTGSFSSAICPASAGSASAKRASARAGTSICRASAPRPGAATRCAAAAT
jgi:hypothetical protein